MGKKKRQGGGDQGGRVAGAAPGRTGGSAVPVLLLVLLATFVVYLPSLGNGFTNWDDPEYVTGNRLVSAPDLGAILTTPVQGNYHPLTIVSLALNYKISGYEPSSYHWLNVLLHVANTGLVFAFIWSLSAGRLKTAAATSLLFGIHPMHVESVAWVSERKDVLYAFFYLLGLILYLRYARTRRLGTLGVCLAVFVLSLASKPAAVVFPVTLLLLDLFEARRDWSRMILEKVPFFALSLGAGLLTLQAQRMVGAVENPVASTALSNALYASYGGLMYVVSLFLPFRLSAVYPYPPNGPGPATWVAAVVMWAVIPALLFAFRRLRPLLFGWAFFLVNIALVLQFLSVGQVLMADRYTYVPYIGLLLALTWWLDEAAAPGHPDGGWGVSAIVIVLLIPICLWQTWVRCGVWKDSETLWRDTISKYPSAVAHNNLGNTLARKGDIAGATANYREAIRLDPRYARAHGNLGRALGLQGRMSESIAEYREALRLKEDFVDARVNLAASLAMQGQLDEAMTHLRRVLELDPAHAEARFNLNLMQKNAAAAAAAKPQATPRPAK
jgi:tetratricopeptide (TPR) repeat protein